MAEWTPADRAGLAGEVEEAAEAGTYPYLRRSARELADLRAQVRECRRP